tara:strand:+ start:40265 stop:40624 length:360 start_codon:yes stop_codon:yes gene_type:complete
MKSRQSLICLGAPALVAAMMVQAAPGEQMQQHEPMQQMDQENMQQMKNADMQECAGMQGMDKSKMDMNDPAVQEKMQKCMKMMDGDKMMDRQMQGGGKSPQTGEPMQDGNKHGQHHDSE